MDKQHADSEAFIKKQMEKRMLLWINLKNLVRTRQSTK
jgi:hypothetical protein